MGILSFLFGKSSFGGNSVKPQTEALIKHEWEQIELLVSQKGPSQLRQALLKADKCLDNALGDVVDGETMGERLKNAITKYDQTTYNKIWSAHKMRNSLVHEVGYEPPHHMVLDGIATFKKALEKLGLKL